MCGICGIVGAEGRAAESGVRKMMSALVHRGPDDEGILLRPGAILGVRRLSIIDLSTGDQPITNEDGRVHIVVNGEFYDFERQRRELEQRGHRFRTRSDSEIALHLYEETNVHCLHRLRGEFAFVIWDEKQQTLFAARDRFGIKPLFYAWHNRVLYIASEVKALFAAGVPARWDRDRGAAR